MKKTTEQFISDARAVHGDRYDYSDVEYVNAHTPVAIRCPKHGVFKQRPSAHTNNKSGCPACAGRPVIDTKLFVERARQIHGDRYDYSNVSYMGNKTPVNITCPIHGDFQMTPISHLDKSRGCPKCTDGYYEKYTTEDWVSRATEVHNGKYQYDSVNYTGAFDKMEISCPEHGYFSQNSHDHLMGRGCPACAKIISKPETDLVDFFESMGVRVLTNVRTVIPPYEVDLFCPDYGLAVEYCGLWWHSVDRGKSKSYHLEKHVRCEQEGIRLITIFEDEWLDGPERVKSVLRHCVGKSPRGVGARKTKIEKIPWNRARPFLNQYHLQGAGSPGIVQYGAFDGDDLIGVAVFGLSSGERSRKEIELKRYVCDGRNHPGLASKMFHHGMGENDWKEIVAYVDRRWFTGSFKYESGFQKDGVVGPTLHYAKGKRRFNRRFVTKNRLIQEGADPSRTKREILADRGYFQIYDAGRIRLIYRRD